MQQNKIGTLYGVFIPNVTMMFGVILFLRLGLITAHAGLWVTLGVIILSLLIMLITSASIASIATNMEVGSGGVYYLITRSLGIEIGGALGFAIYISQLLSIALTTSGFAYTIADIFPHLNVTIIEIITLLGLAFLSSASSKVALQMQGIILVILMLSIVSVFIGTASGLNVPVEPKPFYEGGKLSFWLAFALLYPAMTGIEAGMALSGSLKDPAKSLMIGNMTSLLFVAVTYAMVIIFSFLYIPHNLLISDPFALVDFARPTWMVTVGICAATLSSALGSLLGAPRILQSMSEDGVVPKIFSKTYGKYIEPRWALAFTTIIALIITVGTNIDQIIPVLSMICLIGYALLNLISAMGSLMNSPSWRPRFKVHYSISLLGAFLALVSMFMINPGWSFASITIVSAFYLMLRRREIEVGFKDLRNSLLFFFSRLALYRLSKSDEHALTWHPKLLVLAVAPSQHMKLVWLADSLTKQSGILTFASIVPDEWSDPEKIYATKLALEGFFEKHNVDCLIEVQTYSNVKDGYINLVKSYGIGPIQPNTIVLPLEQNNAKEIDVDDKLPALMEACYVTRKNIILFRDSDKIKEKLFNKRFFKLKKQIDIWWDSEARDSFDLLVSFVTTLHDSSNWSNSNVNLKAIVAVSEAKVTVQNFLKSFIAKSRLKMKAKTYLLPDDSSIKEKNNYLHEKYIQEYSKDAHLVLVPLKPFSNEVTQEEYAKYLFETFKKTSNIKGIVMYICSYDSTEHREIYTYPE